MRGRTLEDVWFHVLRLTTTERRVPLHANTQQSEGKGNQHVYSPVPTCDDVHFDLASTGGISSFDGFSSSPLVSNQNLQCRTCQNRPTTKTQSEGSQRLQGNRNTSFVFMTKTSKIGHLFEAELLTATKPMHCCCHRK